MAYQPFPSRPNPNETKEDYVQRMRVSKPPGALLLLRTKGHPAPKRVNFQTDDEYEYALVLYNQDREDSMYRETYDRYRLAEQHPLPQGGRSTRRSHRKRKTYRRKSYRRKTHRRN